MLGPRYHEIPKQPDMDYYFATALKFDGSLGCSSAWITLQNDDIIFVPNQPVSMLQEIVNYSVFTA